MSAFPIKPISLEKQHWEPLHASDRGKADKKRQLASPTSAFHPKKTNLRKLSQESSPQHPLKQKPHLHREGERAYSLFSHLQSYLP